VVRPLAAGVLTPNTARSPTPLGGKQIGAFKTWLQLDTYTGLSGLRGETPSRWTANRLVRKRYLDRKKSCNVQNWFAQSCDLLYAHS